MAVTTLLQWNPTQSNQESDAQYAADSTRVGGAVDPSVFFSILANKAFNQWSNYLTALFTAFANKGFGTSDANFATLVAQCANFLTTADLTPGLQVVAYASSVAFDASRANGFKVTLSGSLNFTISNQKPGQIITLIWTIPGGGGSGWSIGYPAQVLGGGQPVLGANNSNVQSFVVDDALTLRPIGAMTVS